jgi:hypothetical protein
MYFGGAVAFTVDQFFAVNGYSNMIHSSLISGEYGFLSIRDFLSFTGPKFLGFSFSIR